MNPCQHPGFRHAGKLLSNPSGILFLLLVVFGSFPATAQDALQIDSTGNVGIGIAARKNTRLTVNGWG
ncbi:MAG: hypothetical protein ABW019_00605 [Chitinophagaceae bacterium]